MTTKTVLITTRLTTVEDLIAALQSAVERAERHPSELYVEPVYGLDDGVIVQMVEETLTDGSIAFNVRFR